MNKRLHNQVAVVTGAGGGIGREIALSLAIQGACVVVNDLGVSDVQGTGATSAKAADQVVEEIQKIGGHAVANYDSVATMKGGESIIDTALKTYNRLDILVNNAGIVRAAPIYKMSEKDWDDVINTHLKGHFTCTRFASEVMKEQKYGRIVNISSEAGLMGAFHASYSAAKEGILGFTRGVARDLGRYAITCNAIRPRAFTRMGTAEWFIHEKEYHENLGIEVPAWIDPCLAEPELSSPANIAPFATYLASPEAGYINGQDFVVWAGHVMLQTIPGEFRSIHKQSSWSLDELEKIVPLCLMKDVKNPTKISV